MKKPTLLACMFGIALAALAALAGCHAGVDVDPHGSSAVTLSR
jgi:hypothetical protein